MLLVSCRCLKLRSCLLGELGDVGVLVVCISSTYEVVFVDEAVDLSFDIDNGGVEARPDGLDGLLDEVVVRQVACGFHDTDHDSLDFDTAVFAYSVRRSVDLPGGMILPGTVLRETEEPFSWRKAVVETEEGTTGGTEVCAEKDAVFHELLGVLRDHSIGLKVIFSVEAKEYRRLIDGYFQIEHLIVQVRSEEHFAQCMKPRKPSTRLSCRVVHRKRIHELVERPRDGDVR